MHVCNRADSCTYMHRTRGTRENPYSRQSSRRQSQGLLNPRPQVHRPSHEQCLHMDVAGIQVPRVPALGESPMSSRMNATRPRYQRTIAGVLPRPLSRACMSCSESKHDARKMSLLNMPSRSINLKREAAMMMTDALFFRPLPKSPRDLGEFFVSEIQPLLETLRGLSENQGPLNDRPPKDHLLKDLNCCESEMLELHVFR